jgi:hypothetical protein
VGGGGGYFSKFCNSFRTKICVAVFCETSKILASSASNLFYPFSACFAKKEEKEEFELTLDKSCSFNAMKNKNILPPAIIFGKTFWTLQAFLHGNDRTHTKQPDPNHR